jgi:arsenate reductase
MYGLAIARPCQKAQAELEAAGWQIDFRDVKAIPAVRPNGSA